MTKKFLLSLLFIIVFMLVLSACDKVSAFEFEADGNTYNTNDLELYKYSLIYWFNSSTHSEIDIITSDKPLIGLDETIENVYRISLSNADIKTYYMMTDRGYWQGGRVISDISTSISNSQIIYLNYDICDEGGNVIFKSTTNQDSNIYFNFRYNDLIYSIYGKNLFLWKYTTVFLNGNYALVNTNDEKPTYYYENYTHYMVTNSPSNMYIFNFTTNTLELLPFVDARDDSKYYFAFNPEQLIYSNFSLYNNIGTRTEIFDNLSYKADLGRDYDGNIGNLATGNLQASGSSGGNSFLDDYINSQDPNYKGSTNQGSDTITGGFNGVYSKFGFAEDVKKNVNGMVDVITNTKEAPKFQINVNSKYYKGTLTIVDLSWYAPYKEMGDNVICIFAYLGFLWRIFIRLPDIIRGAGASSYAPNMLGDIEAFRKTGFGRSSSPRSKTF